METFPAVARPWEEIICFLLAAMVRSWSASTSDICAEGNLSGGLAELANITTFCSAPDPRRMILYFYRLTRQTQ